MKAKVYRVKELFVLRDCCDTLWDGAVSTMGWRSNFRQYVVFVLLGKNDLDDESLPLDAEMGVLI